MQISPSSDLEIICVCSDCRTGFSEHSVSGSLIISQFRVDLSKCDLCFGLQSDSENNGNMFQTKIALDKLLFRNSKLRNYQTAGHRVFRKSCLVARHQDTVYLFWWHLHMHLSYFWGQMCFVLELKTKGMFTLREEDPSTLKFLEGRPSLFHMFSVFSFHGSF